MKIQEKPSFDTPFEWIGGEARVQALTERFYDLMDLEPGYNALRAVQETGVPEDLRSRLRESFFQTADWMRNQNV